MMEKEVGRSEAANEMQKLIETLNCCGADIAGVVDRFENDAELYRECIGDFLCDSAVDSLGEALAAGDGKAAFSAAHTMCGVAANLGLTQAASYLSAIVEPLRRGEGCAALLGGYAQLKAELDRLSSLFLNVEE